ncbi:hypothetical protein QJS04_geneDACA022735 [Acorus gramineus]|uniref:Uncharacterized protein n=1 Tax=Acorus gramineus TaxID=55184 RepID=A0AAV9AGJ5_ACOGR|nr:hypothetical protein QJS04_geneDACA022735 [Acorus gramineus]
MPRRRSTTSTRSTLPSSAHWVPAVSHWYICFHSIFFTVYFATYTSFIYLFVLVLGRRVINFDGN